MHTIRRAFEPQKIVVGYNKVVEEKKHHSFDVNTTTKQFYSKGEKVSFLGTQLSRVKQIAPTKHQQGLLGQDSVRPKLNRPGTQAAATSTNVEVYHHCEIVLSNERLCWFGHSFDGKSSKTFFGQIISSSESH